MRIQVASEESDWVNKIWTWVHNETRPQSRVFLPAGNTPVAAYKRWCETPTKHLKSLRFVQIDDIISGPMRYHFKQFFETELTPYLKQFEWIGEASGGADVAILGVGLNGHVAFHEPSLPRDFYSGCVSLTTETCRYLNLEQPTWGLTYGASSFLSCRKILVLARGEQKREVLKQASNRNLPISWILQHKDCTLITDFKL